MEWLINIHEIRLHVYLPRPNKDVNASLLHRSKNTALGSCELLQFFFFFS